MYRSGQRAQAGSQYKIMLHDKQNDERLRLTNSKRKAYSTVILTGCARQADWYALVANAEFMLHDVQNEALAEQLRERKRLFGEQDRKLDFFLVSEPTWLDERYPEEAKRVRRPCVALVSTDRIWITCALPGDTLKAWCAWGIRSYIA